MNELLATLGGLVAALGNSQSAGVLRERVVLIQEQLSLAQKQAAQLTQANIDLRQRLEEAEKQLTAQRIPEQMTKHRAAYFRRDHLGAWEPVVYCFRCRQPAFAFPPGAEFNCSACGWVSSFTESNLPTVMAGLPE
jgi:hypothetical protein